MPPPRGVVMAAIPLAYQGYKAGKNMMQGPPAPPDYMGLAREQGNISERLLNQQTQANRPNQSTPFASSNWSQGPDGQWTQQVGFNGPLAGGAERAQLSAAEMMGQPLDMSGLQELSSGEDVQRQAIDAAYGQAASRLDPRFGKQREALRTQLLNQGLAEGSQAYRQAMGEFGQQENDAYNQAMYGAIGQGTQAGQAIFGRNLAARQQGLGELLRQRAQPMEDLQALQGLTVMPGFQGAGVAQAPNLLGAAGMQDQANMQRYQISQQQMAEILGMLGQLASTGIMAASDERMKENVERLPYEVLPGVPLARWDWRPEHDGAGPNMGVVAQDLQQVLPEAVHEGEDGYLMVDYGALKEFL